jgi:hypothetical protein
MSLNRIAELEAKLDIERDEYRRLYRAYSSAMKRLESYESRNTSMIPPALGYDVNKYPFRLSFDGPMIDIDNLLPLAAQGD